MSDSLMTTKELALLINVKPATIRYWVYMKSIPYIKLNGSVRFSQTRINEWLMENQQGNFSTAS